MLCLSARFLNTIFLILLTILIAAACRKSLSHVSVVEQNATKFHETNLDDYINKEFTNPYGIEVVYRWNRNYTENKYSSPPDLNKVKPVLETIKELWIGTYNLLGGNNFMLGKNPIRILLYGGPNVKTIGEGTDEVIELVDGSTSSPIEMAIYNVNSFDISSEDQVFGLMQTVHHQFVMRLLDLAPYDKKAFLKISGGKYFSDLQGIAEYLSGNTNSARNGASPTLSSEQSNTLKSNERKTIFGLNNAVAKEGFFTVQARLSPESDIAETIAIMLTNSNTEVSNIIRVAKTNTNPIPKNLITVTESESEETNTEQDIELDEARNQDYQAERRARYAYETLTKKQKFVSNYMDKAFGISLEKMQLISNERTKKWLSKHKKS